MRADSHLATNRCVRPYRANRRVQVRHLLRSPRFLQQFLKTGKAMESRGVDLAIIARLLCRNLPNPPYQIACEQEVQDVSQFPSFPVKQYPSLRLLSVIHRILPMCRSRQLRLPEEKVAAIRRREHQEELPLPVATRSMAEGGTKRPVLPRENPSWQKSRHATTK